MHQSFVPRAHLPQGGLGIAEKCARSLSFHHPCSGGGGGVFDQNSTDKNKTAALQSQIAEVLPSVCPRSAGLLEGICWTEETSKVPAIPCGWGCCGYK